MMCIWCILPNTVDNPVKELGNIIPNCFNVGAGGIAGPLEERRYLLTVEIVEELIIYIIFYHKLIFLPLRGGRIAKRSILSSRDKLRDLTFGGPIGFGLIFTVA
jgi:hypothetical protein